MGFDVVRVESLRGAAALLATEADTRFLGGGTLVVRQINSGSASIRKLLLADKLGLDRITVDAGRAEIGAAATMAAVAEHPALGFLHVVAHSTGGPAVRAMATVGGNLFARYPYGDFTVALLALGATVTEQDSAAESTADLESFLANRDRKSTVVKSVAFSLPSAGAFRFLKATRKNPHGACILSIAAFLPIESGKIAGARIAYGAMAKHPIRGRAAERALEGRALDRDSIDAALSVAAQGCAPESDPQASAWYRLNVLPVHLRRLLGA